MSDRLITVKEQGADEIIEYLIDVTEWGDLPSSVVIKVYDVTNGAYTDVSITVLTGSPSVLNNIITLPKLGALTAGKVYRVEVKFSAGGQTFEPFFIVECQK